MNPQVTLVVIATGKYGQFVPGLVESARRHLTGYRETFVLSDAPLERGLDAKWLPWGHMPWPYPTLMRYRAISAYASEFSHDGHLYYVDADMRFVGRFSVPKIDQGLVAVEHPGYVGSPRECLPFERRPISRAAVPVERGHRYVAGGFQGGPTACFLAAARTLAGWIHADLMAGVMPVWHDESMWNRLVLGRDDVVTLDANHCWPEEKPNPQARLLALQKNHAEVRGLAEATDGRVDVSAKQLRSILSRIMRGKSR